MSVFERWLTLWVFLCIVAGIALGQFLPAPFQALGRMEVAQVNLPVGLLIWVMIIPMLVKVDFGALHEVRQHVKGIGVTLFVNWLVKPFSMALLGWIFIRQLFAPYAAGRPARQLHRRPDPARRRALHRDGLRLEPADQRRPAVHAVAGGGERHHHGLRLRPHRRPAARHLGHRRTVGHAGHLGGALHRDPAGAGAVVAQGAAEKGPGAFRRRDGEARAVVDLALLATLVLLFAFQGKAIVDKPLIIALLAVPILIQVFFNSALAYWLNRVVGEKHNVACPSALIGASNFFELAVAAAISLFGFESGAALATVVGVLIEVPVMLLVVKVVNSSKGWYERGA
jgi:ACR3 family arsenite transporter